MTKSSTSARQRRSFTPEFKAEAVRIARTPGKSSAQVARELDLTVTCLRAWVKQAAMDARPTAQGPLTTDERTELTRLRRELRAGADRDPRGTEVHDDVAPAGRW